MTIQTALAKLRRRNPNFSTLKSALNHNALPSSNGWVNLERKYDELNVPAMTSASYASKLEKIYRDNIDWGNKAVQFAVSINPRTEFSRMRSRTALRLSTRQ